MFMSCSRGIGRLCMRLTDGSTKLVTIAVATATILAGCASLPKGPQMYTGSYFYNFENAMITLAGTEDRLCVSGGLSSAELPSGWGTADVVVEGTVGPEGPYGNLGSRCRVITITKVIDVRNRRDTHP